MNQNFEEMDSQILVTIASNKVKETKELRKEITKLSDKLKSEYDSKNARDMFFKKQFETQRSRIENESNEQYF